ncbi:protein YgfX [Sinimarinibacterium sp. NLF-5-8]|uniref:protein YgfX n=1 Tax=Sinimarinibacterium sp. NLF-5-8 TaxID=2698684 RepID=UPI00137C0040|nr:protein YgfX [Sinimarinibacterium sp. NLF-5-8]QHS09353.1 hypothetical protein GT972_03740 [Sinimarinibacterium sp. NLF-5-8]
MLNTLDVRFRPSMRAMHGAFALHAVCLLLLLLADPPKPALLTLGAAMGLSWLWVRRHPALGFGARAIEGVIAHDDGHWTLLFAQQQSIERAQLLGDSRVKAGWLVLRFKTPQMRTLTRIIHQSELAPDAARQLRAWLFSKQKWPQAPEK